MDKVEQGQITEVVISGDNISGKYMDGNSFQTTAPPKDPDLIKSLRQKNVRIVVVPPEQTSWYMSILISWFPMLLLLGIWNIFYAADAVRWWKGHVFWQEQGTIIK